MQHVLSHNMAHYARALASHPKRYSARNGARLSAVIAPLAMVDGEECVLFAKRGDHLESHPGQICFPGGKPEPEDADLWRTALRETQEELSLTPGDLVLLGELDDVRTITGFVIRPFVAEVVAPEKLKPDSAEIEHAFWVPLQELLHPANYGPIDRDLLGGVRCPMQAFTVCEPPVWGATARIVRNLLGVLRGWRDPSPEKP